MRNSPLLIFVFIFIFSAAGFADNFLDSNHLVQLYSLQDSCILDVKEGKCYLNSEKINISENKIFLNSDVYGPLIISHLMQDAEGMYTVGVYYIYRCNNCGASYNYNPSQCSICHGTSFSYVEQLPDD